MSEPLQPSRSTNRSVDLTGEIDLANAGAVGDQLLDTINHATNAVVVDLTNVTFIDSTAIAMMIRVHQHANVRHRTVTWRGARPNQRRVLDIAGVVRYLNLAE